ncbi:MAG: hypothetical protein JWN24_1287 [Phycisphaerales bacterium]|nr:hypothetical protein [Phycisphaerales bacterium]
MEDGFCAILYPPSSILKFAANHEGHKKKRGPLSRASFDSKWLHESAAY